MSLATAIAVSSSGTVITAATGPEFFVVRRCPLLHIRHDSGLEKGAVGGGALPTEDDPRAARHRPVDLIFEPCRRVNGRQRRNASRFVEWISHLKRGEPLPETVDKFVADRAGEMNRFAGSMSLT